MIGEVHMDINDDYSCSGHLTKLFLLSDKILHSSIFKLVTFIYRVA